jgi:hypothetical protein
VSQECYFYLCDVPRIPPQSYFFPGVPPGYAESPQLEVTMVQIEIRWGRDLKKPSNLRFTVTLGKMVVIQFFCCRKKRRACRQSQRRGRRDAPPAWCAFQTAPETQGGLGIPSYSLVQGFGVLRGLCPPPSPPPPPFSFVQYSGVLPLSPLCRVPGYSGVFPIFPYSFVQGSGIFRGISLLLCAGFRGIPGYIAPYSFEHGFGVSRGIPPYSFVRGSGVLLTNKHNDHMHTSNVGDCKPRCTRTAVVALQWWRLCIRLIAANEDFYLRNHIPHLMSRLWHRQTVKSINQSFILKYTFRPTYACKSAV